LDPSEHCLMPRHQIPNKQSGLAPDSTHLYRL